MELSNKIQKLRKKNNLTQEQLAEKLFVSRTAVSKWETGRGTPNIESLKLIANIFNISLDQLLSADEIVVIAEIENKENIKRFSSYIDSLINLSALLALLLPIYKVEENGFFYSVPLYQFGNWQRFIFWILPIIIAVCGILQIIFLHREKENFKNITNIIAVTAHICEIFLLIFCGQPYPATLFFFLFVIKFAFFMKKHR